MKCEWCRNAEVVTEVETQPAKYRTDKRTGSKVMAKVAKKVKVCRDCQGIVERQLSQARAAKEKGASAPRDGDDAW